MHACEELFHVRRTVQRVTDKVRIGKDHQVDDKALVIQPSYAGYPATDPFIALSEDWISSPGFDWHPHRGVETVTIVVDGVLEHGDSLGNAGLLTTGDVQWMTAGRGIIHREHAHRDEYAHTLQLWINLPAALKMTETRYQDLRAAELPVYLAPGLQVRMMSWYGADPLAMGAAASRIRALVIQLEPGRSYAQLLPADHRVFAYLLEGEATIGGRPVAAGQIAWSDPAADVPAPVGGDGASYLDIQASDGDRQATVLLFSGRPLREPVAAGASFVMNTEDEIRQAIKDYESGKFGEIPRTARL
jgi:redox-sensitive bicupin YhaK (pirin superfamily)